MLPHIANVEFLSDTQYGLGVRFREIRLMRPLIRGMVPKEVEKDMDFVKQHCEQVTVRTGRQFCRSQQF